MQQSNFPAIDPDVTTLQKGCSYMLPAQRQYCASDVTTLQKGCSYM